MLFGIINIYAVIVASVLAMGLGSLWYSKILFGNQWRRLRGVDPRSVDHMRMPASKMLVEFICTLVVAFVVSFFVALISATLPLSTAIYAAIVLALFIWVGFYVSALLSEVLWEDKPFGVFLITASLRLVNLVAITLVLVFWR